MFSNAKISVYNWIIIGLLALTFIVFAKMLVGGTFLKKIPGVSNVVEMA